MAIYAHLEPFTVVTSHQSTLQQLQVVISSGVVHLEVSQDGLPFTVVETFNSDLVRLVRFSDAVYRFNITGSAQCSVINTKLR